MEIKDVEKLKQWLLKRLEPLCDADPAALAKYVVALLRKEKPKSSLKELCIDQLEVFLAKETVIFVDNLFTVLESENYLKKEVTQTPSPSPSPPPPPLTGNPGNSNGATTTTVPSPPCENSTVRIVIDRRQSEDTPKNNKEVDDEDRDFRRSRRTDTNYGIDTTSKRLITTSTLPQTRKPGSIVTTTDPDRARKRRGDQETVPNKMPRRGEGEVLGSVRRPVRERLGPKPDDRSDARGRRSWRDRSRTPDSDSDSSTGGSSRKRPRASGGKYSDNRKSQRCKDYDEKGFCMLGEKCPYDHGIDPLVIGTVNPYTPALPLGLPPPLPPLNMPNPSMLLPPVVPPSLTGRVSPSNTSTDGYNPEDPSLTSTAVSAPPSLIPPRIIPPPLPMRPSFPPPLHGVTIPPPPSLTTLPPHLMMPPPFRSTIHYPRPIRPPVRLTDTLVVRKVPRDINSITKLSSHFEKFGTIVHLTVRYEGDPESALVQFSNPYEAKRAHDSTEAVLNNRFIRIYYLRKDNVGPIIVETTPGSVAVSAIRGPPAVPETQGPPPTFLSNHGDREERSATEPFLSTPKPPPSIPDHPTLPTTKPLASPTPPMVNTAGGQHRRQPQQKVEIAKKQLELQKRSQALLQKQIDQQKLLISKLEKTGKHLTTEEKAKIMETLKSISSNISKLKDTSAMKTTSVKTELRIPKELLEQQHQASTTTEGATSPVNALKQKAHALRMQAHKLGLISNVSQPLPPAVGMGKSHPQPGGVDLRTKLESKPRQLLVINVEEKDPLTAYFESFGGLLQVEVVPDKPKNLIFTFRNHSSAQMVVRSGSVFNGRPLIMKWHSPKAAATTLPSPTPSPASIQRQTSLEHPTTASITEEQVTTPTLVKPDPADLHLVDDDEEEENEGRSWRR